MKLSPISDTVRNGSDDEARKAFLYSANQFLDDPSSLNQRLLERLMEHYQKRGKHD